MRLQTEFKPLKTVRRSVIFANTMFPHIWTDLFPTSIEDQPFAQLDWHVNCVKSWSMVLLRWNRNHPNASKAAGRPGGWPFTIGPTHHQPRTHNKTMYLENLRLVCMVCRNSGIGISCVSTTHVSVRVDFSICGRFATFNTRSTTSSPVPQHSSSASQHGPRPQHPSFVSQHTTRSQTFVHFSKPAKPVFTTRWHHHQHHHHHHHHDQKHQHHDDLFHDKSTAAALSCFVGLSIAGVGNKRFFFDLLD